MGARKEKKIKKGAACSVWQGKPALYGGGAEKRGGARAPGHVCRVPPLMQRGLTRRRATCYSAGPYPAKRLTRRRVLPGSLPRATRISPAQLRPPRPPTHRAATPFSVSPRRPDSARPPDPDTPPKNLPQCILLPVSDAHQCSAYRFPRTSLPPAASLSSSPPLPPRYVLPVQRGGG